MTIVRSSALPSNPDPGRAQRLADVYARAERLRRRRRARLGTGALLGSLAAFMGGLLVGSNLGVPQQLTTIGRPDAPASTTTTESEPTTTTAGLPVVPDARAQRNTPPDREAVEEPVATPAEPGVPAVTSTAPTTAPPPTSTTVPNCRNSRDPACGPLRYEPPPVNEPMTVEVAFSPTDPEPGEEITFTVRLSDDGPVSRRNCLNTQTYGEVGERVVLCTVACAPTEPRYGLWDPPPPENSAFEETFRHTYDESGTYTATFAYNQGADCTSSPYRSTGEASVTVTVE
jgi:hypothetical protein